MPVLKSAVDTRSDEFRANAAAMAEAVGALRRAAAATGLAAARRRGQRR